MTAPSRATRPAGPAGAPDDDPLWYKDAVVYQVHIRSFFDSDGDGIGDIKGLTERLDYIQDLGVTAVWILPFYPSPLRDEGYDIADYQGVNPAYGTLRQFKQLLREAHRRGLRVITELVINHTSDQHPWFQRARTAPAGSRWRDFYVWSDTTDRYRDARVIFQDFETSNWTWDPVADAYYWHRFYSHQPDLNYESPDVRDAVFKVLDFWLDMGVDGLRLDAVPYLYEADGTNCENLPATHRFLKDLRAHVDERYGDRMLLAEANQWPEDAAAYFGQGDGDECHMNFHFPLMPRLFMATRMEDRYPVIDILQQTPEVPPTSQWAIFLRNHDELTLEMVTDEERDYMYRAYAHDRQARVNLGIRRRLAPLMGNSRHKTELMNGLLLSLPGTPIIYYGDEIGMGDNIYLGDRNGVRTPMQWSPDRNAGFSKANPQQLYLPPVTDPEYHYETVNVEAQLANSESLLWWMKRLIALRRRHRVFGRGTIEFLHPDNPKVLAYLRRTDEEQILVVANLSRHAQYVELDLSEFKGRNPVELFGGNQFPAIGDLPYLLTLGAHQFLWMALPTADVDGGDGERLGEPPTIEVTGRWDEVLRPKAKARQAVEAALPRFLAGRRWFGGKARKVQRAVIDELLSLPKAGEAVASYLAIVEVEYAEGEPETYAVPMSVVTRGLADLIEADVGHAIVARLHRREGRTETALLIEAMVDPSFSDMLLDLLRNRRRREGEHGELHGRPSRALRAALAGVDGDGPHATMGRAEQSNTSATFGDAAIMKVFRRIGAGVNPDLEIGRFLSEQVRFPNVPKVLGALEYQRSRREDPTTVAVFHELVANEGDSWRYTLDTLGRFFERILGEPEEVQAAGGFMPDLPVLELARLPTPPEADEYAGIYLASAELLGTRTAELHAALASGEDAAFRPEPFTTLYQRSLYQSMRTLTRQTLQTLRRSARNLDGDVRRTGQEILDHEATLLDAFRGLLDHKIGVSRIRTHGDLHLGQVLYTGRDFVIIDFEGEPARPVSERRIKRSALRDVAGMIRSFDYAGHAGLRDLEQRGVVTRDTDTWEILGRWASSWALAASSRYLGSYLETAAGQPFLPDDDGDLALLLDVYVLEKAIYELGYELNNRPGWAAIPMKPILDFATSR